MVIIGLTGNIATGKSTVSEMFRNKHDIPVIDADLIAREVVEPGEKALAEIVHTFGETILLEDDSLNRQKLGGIIFKDNAKREQLNKIVHPAVRERMEEKKQALLTEGYNTIVLDIPLLYENNLTYLVDKTIVVYTDEMTQLKRLTKRNQLSQKEAKDRMKAQMDLERKKKLADAVIDNSNAITATEKQLQKLLESWNLI